MKRVSVNPRPDWQDRLDKLGFYYHSVDGNYWQENACYVFTMAQIEKIETATYDLHDMYMQAVAHVIKNGDYARLGIDEHTAMLIEQSWQRQDPCLYGRFDLSYNPLQGDLEPKLLEYNADTPTALFEASVAQWYWLVEQQPQVLPPEADQFNSIHERLLIEWGNIAKHFFEKSNGQFSVKHGVIDNMDSAPYQEFLHNFTMHFSAISESEEDFTTTRYLQDTAIQAGLTTAFIDIADIGWNSERKRFVDWSNAPIDYLFKLYPWEWLAEEEFAKHIANNATSAISDSRPKEFPTTNWLEPAWKGLISNKGMLAILWEMFPNHPNLLPCYFSAQQLSPEQRNEMVKKPFFSREGANIELTHQGKLIQTDGDYGDTLIKNNINSNHSNEQGYVYQACQPLPKFVNGQGADCYAVIGSWVVGHCSAGIGIREDDSLITKDSSLFVPHVIID